MKKYLFALFILLAFSINNYAQNIKATDTINNDNEPIFALVQEPAKYPDVYKRQVYIVTFAENPQIKQKVIIMH